MRTLTIAILGTFLLSLFGVESAEARERGTKQEARALAERACLLLEDAGEETTYQAFSDPQGEFVDRDLYVFVMRTNGGVVAHGANRAYLGKNLSGIRDARGHALVDEAIATTIREKAGWTEPYSFPDPYTGKLGSKQSYVILSDRVVLGVGVFLPPA